MAFRRLAYHRSYFLLAVGALGLAAAVAYAIVAPWDDPTNDGFAIGTGGAVSLLILARGATGSWSQKQLRVDIPAGKLKLPDGSIHSLDELGALTIESHLLPPPNRHRVHEYRLRAANLGYYLFYSVYESETTIRLVKVDSAVLQSRLRRVLERPSGDGSAFRSAPDAVPEIRAIAETPERALAALDTLAREDGPEIRARARQVADTLRRAA